MTVLTGFLGSGKTTLLNWLLRADHGFKLAVGEAPGDAGQPLFHSDRFVLVDRGGRIRGYYSAMDSNVLVRLVADLRSVAKEPEA